MSSGLLGCITTPDQRNKIPEAAVWCADNGVFGKGYPGDERWWAWVQALPRGGCAFVVAPDVVGDAHSTLLRSIGWLPEIRAAGFPAAFVAQDGQELLEVPWAAFDVLFIGGSTAWKMGPAARRLTLEAKARGVPVHMGRVNSERRLRYAEAIGCDSADGTILTYGPAVNLLRVLRWLRIVDQPALHGLPPEVPR